MLVPASDSGIHDEQYCCIGPGILHIGAAKIAPLVRTAVGYHSSALGV